MVDFAGWDMPVQYSGILDEHRAVRERAGLFDVSHMGRLEVSGPASTQVVDSLVTQRVRELESGRAAYGFCCNDAGFILDDIIVYRLGAEEWLVICNAGNREPITSLFAETSARLGANFVDRSDATALIALQGPRARALLPEAAALKRFRVETLIVEGIPARIACTGYTGEDGFELMCDAGQVEALWKLLLRRGEGELLPAGLGARDTLRMEASLPLYGHEIDAKTRPFEAGLARFVALDKGDFLGQAALRAAAEAELPRQLVGLVMKERGIARQGYAVIDEAGEVVGEVTSGGPSPTLQQNIAMAYVPLRLSALGSSVKIQIRDKRVAAEVVAMPFYRRSK